MRLRLRGVAGAAGAVRVPRRAVGGVSPARARLRRRRRVPASAAEARLVAATDAGLLPDRHARPAAAAAVADAVCASHEAGDEGEERGKERSSAAGWSTGRDPRSEAAAAAKERVMAMRSARNAVRVACVAIEARGLTAEVPEACELARAAVWRASRGCTVPEMWAAADRLARLGFPADSQTYAAVMAGLSRAPGKRRWLLDAADRMRRAGLPLGPAHFRALFRSCEHSGGKGRLLAALLDEAEAGGVRLGGTALEAALRAATMTHHAGSANALFARLLDRHGGRELARSDPAAAARVLALAACVRGSGAAWREALAAAAAVPRPGSALALLRWAVALARGRHSWLWPVWAAARASGRPPDGPLLLALAHEARCRPPGSTRGLELPFGGAADAWHARARGAPATAASATAERRFWNAAASLAPRGSAAATAGARSGEWHAWGLLVRALAGPGTSGRAAELSGRAGGGEALTAAAYGLLLSGQPREACLVALRPGAAAPPSECFAAAVEGAAECGDRELLRSAWRGWKAAHLDAAGGPSAASYSPLVWGAAAGRSWDAVAAAFAEMRRRGVAPLREQCEAVVTHLAADPDAAPYTGAEWVSGGSAADAGAALSEREWAEWDEFVAAAVAPS